MAGERVLLLDEGHCMRDQALAICNESEATIDARQGDFRATSIETLRHMVASGMGSTLLPALALTDRRDAADATCALPFASPPPDAAHGARLARTHPRGKDHRLLAEWIRGHLPEGVQALARGRS